MARSTITGDTGNTAILTYSGAGNPLPPGKFSVTGGGPATSFDIGSVSGSGASRSWTWTANGINWRLRQESFESSPGSGVFQQRWAITNLTLDPNQIQYIGPAGASEPIGTYSPTNGGTAQLTLTNYPGTHFSIADFAIRSIDQAEESLGRIDTSVLTTQTYRTFIMEDMAETPELTIEFLWETFAPLGLGLAGSTSTPVAKNIGIVTLTYPLRPNETKPATRSGLASVAAFKQPMLANNELQIGTMRIQFLESPTYSPAL